MNEAIVRAGEWRQQGEEGRLGWPVYWLDHMFSWPACYSALFSLRPLTEELELLEMISQNAVEQYSQFEKSPVPSWTQLFSDVVSVHQVLCLYCSNCGCCPSPLWMKCGFRHFFPQVTPPFRFWLPSLQQLYTRGHHCAVDAYTDLLVRMSHYHVKRVKPREWPSVFTTCVTQGALTRPQTQTADHTDSLKWDTLSLKSWTRTGALAKCTDVNQCISAALYKGKISSISSTEDTPGFCMKPTCWGMGQSYWQSWSGHLGP